MSKELALRLLKDLLIEQSELKLEKPTEIQLAIINGRISQMTCVCEYMGISPEDINTIYNHFMII